MIFNLGQKIKLSTPQYESKKLSNRRRVEGNVIYQNDHFFTLEIDRPNNKKYREAFSWSALRGGEVRIAR